MFSWLVSCIKPSKPQPLQTKPVLQSNNTKSFIPTAGFHNDIVFYKFLNTDRYELDTSLIQVWIFDKNRICIHATDNEFKAEYYIGKNMSQVILQEDIFNTFNDIHVLSLQGIESKRTVIYDTRLAYIEGRALYYNEDVHDIYGTMLIFIPYANVNPVRQTNVENQNKVIEKRKATSLDYEKPKHTQHKDDETKQPIKRSNSDGNLHFNLNKTQTN